MNQNSEDNTSSGSCSSCYQRCSLCCSSTYSRSLSFQDHSVMSIYSLASLHFECFHGLKLIYARFASSFYFYFYIYCLFSSFLFFIDFPQIFILEFINYYSFLKLNTLALYSFMYQMPFLLNLTLKFDVVPNSDYCYSTFYLIYAYNV